MTRFSCRFQFAHLLCLLVITASCSLSTQAGIMAPGSVTSFGFTTSGQVGLSGVTGFNAISFKSQADPIWGTTGSRYLGQFLTAPLPTGMSTSYANTPFSISILPTGLQLDGTWYVQPNLQPIVLKGRLNGSITGSDYSSVVASFDPVDPWVDIIQGGIPNTKTFLSGIGPFILNTAGITDVTMSWMTLLSPTVVPVPEPSTLAVISSGLMLAWIARRRSRNLNRA